MQILIITDRIPFPLTNGQNLRIFHFVKNLKKNHDFHLVTYGKKPYPTEVLSLFKEIHVLLNKPDEYKNTFPIWRIAKSFSPDDMFTFDQSMWRLIKSVISTNKFDLVWISGWDMQVYAPHIVDIPVLADVVDEGVLEHLRILRHPQGVINGIVSLKRLLQNYLFERKYFTKGTVCNVVSELDAKFIKWICPGLHVTVVHNGVDTSYFRPLGLMQETSLIFEGRMRFAPNVDGVIYFCKKILPLIREVKSDSKFYIVGDEPLPAVKLLSQEYRDVTVTGYVNDVRPYLDRAAIFVCPLRKGAGIKNKILQAWSMGKAVVATPESCGGLKVNQNENIIIAGKPNEFASAVLSLLNDQGKREKMGLNARETVERYYTWKSKSQDLERVFSLTMEQFKKE